MSRYFDDAARALQALDGTDWKAMGIWKRQIVFDCTVAVKVPGCPAEIRDVVRATSA